MTDSEAKRERQRRYDATEKGCARHRRHNAQPHRKLAKQIEELVRSRIRY